MTTLYKPKFVFITFLLGIGLTNPVSAQENRSIDGTLNHPLFFWGSIFSEVRNKTFPAYSDGISSPAGEDRPNARYISNAVMKEVESINDPLGLSAYTWAWGQFIDHDIVFTPNGQEETMQIAIPAGDQWFDPNNTGQAMIPMSRADYDHSTGHAVGNPRKFYNKITAFIDGSGVYGSDPERANWLRTFEGGKLKTSAGNLLPFNTADGELESAVDPLSPEMDMPIPQVTKWFVAGDVRANENPLLTALHTIFVREHNRLCDEIAAANPGWDDEKIYQRARKIVGAIIQSIVYEEWLPQLGVSLPNYGGYDISANPNIINEFASAAYRFGHSTVNANLARLDANGDPISEGNIALRDAFFNPGAILEVSGIESYLVGATTMLQQNVDCQIVDDLRNFLFGPPGAGGMDLAAMNITRGRDKGLADYNTVRQAMGLPHLDEFDQITVNSRLSKNLGDVYQDINKIDLWVGVLAEDHMPKSIFGPTLMRMMVEQFNNLRVGDRYYYENDGALSSSLKAEIKSTRLADVVKRNTGLDVIPNDIFKALPASILANRTIDGSFNNPNNPTWGAAHSRVLVRTPLAYTDGISSPAGEDRPNVRVISNEIFAQTTDQEDPRGLSAYTWGWGQFIDHDITQFENLPDESMNISIPAFDAYFDPQGTGSATMPMLRTAYDHSTGTDQTNPRIHVNAISSYIDGSAVYGSSEDRASWLRTFSLGKLKTSDGNLLPYNTMSGEEFDAIDPDAPAMDMPFPQVTKYFVAGDIRANENPFLTSIHTVFVREHNRLCDELIQEHPDWTDEMIYQRARKIVGALIESVVYEEWLPTLGMQVQASQGYDQSLDPGIMNVFSSAAFRYGHTTINSTLLRMDDDGHTMPQGDVALRDAFFNPAAVSEVGGIEPYFAGMSTVVQQDFDCHVIDELRNFLFGPPGSGGMDLVSLNLQRGRERGLADYNTIRKSFGMEPISTFAKISPDPVLNQKFASVYKDISKVDPWVGMLAEKKLEGALFGPTAMTIIQHQFLSLRDGDRYYYEWDPTLTPSEIQEIKNTRLADIIRRNTGMTFIPDDVFIAQKITTALAEVNPNQLKFDIYPNPTTDYVEVGLETDDLDNSDWNVEILDLYGKRVMRQTTQSRFADEKITINIGDALPSGTYVLKVTRGDKIGSRQLVKL
ncbi:MAG: T9SS type A sorting domain-containing protein [Saprospiraceae bacterium]|nr:T9SS type A sorting domain-containing protein [Saprospiraceae bacterium]